MLRACFAFTHTAPGYGLVQVALKDLDEDLAETIAIGTNRINPFRSTTTFEVLFSERLW